MIEKTCLNCGILFKTYDDNKKFCSRKCYSEYRTKNGETQ